MTDPTAVLRYQCIHIAEMKTAACEHNGRYCTLCNLGLLEMRLSDMHAKSGWLMTNSDWVNLFCPEDCANRTGCRQTEKAGLVKT